MHSSQFKIVSHRTAYIHVSTLLPDWLKQKEFSTDQVRFAGHFDCHCGHVSILGDLEDDPVLLAQVNQPQSPVSGGVVDDDLFATGNEFYNHRAFTRVMAHPFQSCSEHVIFYFTSLLDSSNTFVFSNYCICYFELDEKAQLYL